MAISRGQADTARDGWVAGLYSAHWLGLVRLALICVGDRPTAEDVVQEVFAEVYSRADKLAEPGKAISYLRAAVLNRSRSVLRRRKVAWKHVDRDPVTVWSAESEVVLGEDRREVMQALQRLTRRRREVLVLRFYADLTDLEIAEMLGIGHGAVRSAISRGIADLRRLLKETS